MQEQRCIYYCRQGMAELDKFIAALYAEYKSPSADPKSEAAKNYLRGFVVKFQKPYQRAIAVMKEFSKFVITSSNNSGVDVKDIISHPNHEKSGHTGLCLLWRQMLFFDQGIIPRCLAILKHVSFATLVQYDSANTKATKSIPQQTDSDQEEEDDELAEIERRRKQEAAQEQEEKEANMREVAFNVYKECTNLLCIMTIDNPDAAACVANQEDRLHLLVSGRSYFAFCFFVLLFLFLF